MAESRIFCEFEWLSVPMSSFPDEEKIIGSIYYDFTELQKIRCISFSKVEIRRSESKVFYHLTVKADLWDSISQIYVQFHI